MVIAHLLYRTVFSPAAGPSSGPCLGVAQACGNSDSMHSSHGAVVALEVIVFAITAPNRDARLQVPSLQSYFGRTPGALHKERQAPLRDARLLKLERSLSGQRPIAYPDHSFWHGRALAVFFSHFDPPRSFSPTLCEGQGTYTYIHVSIVLVT